MTTTREDQLQRLIDLSHELVGGRIGETLPAACKRVRDELAAARQVDPLSSASRPRDALLAAWHECHRQAGECIRSQPRRHDALMEACQILYRLWKGEEVVRG